MELTENLHREVEELRAERDNFDRECNRWMARAHGAADKADRLAAKLAEVTVERDLLRQACADLIEHASDEERRKAAVKEHGDRSHVRTCFCDTCTEHHNAIEAIRFAKSVLGPATAGEGGGAR